MLLPILIATGLCALAPAVEVHSFELTDLIAQEQQVRTVQYPNGTKLMVQQHARPELWTSVRVISRQDSVRHRIFSLDMPSEQTGKMEEFFSYCKEAIKKEGGILESQAQVMNCSFKNDLSGQNGSGGSVSIIAVGDFDEEYLQELVARNFANFAPYQETRPYQAINVITAPNASKVSMHINYATLEQSLGTIGDLREKWVNAFVQEIYQQRMERVAKFFEKPWVHPTTRFLFPRHGYVQVQEEDARNILAVLLWQVEAMKKGGYSTEDFNENKMRMRSSLQYLYANEPYVDSMTLCDYYTDHCLHSDSIPSYGEFLDRSMDLIETISLSDINERLESFLSNENRSIELVYPEKAIDVVLQNDDVEHLLEVVKDVADFYEEGMLPDDAILLLANHDLSKKSTPRFLGPPLKSEARPLPISLANDVKPVADNLAEYSPDLFWQLPLSGQDAKLITYIISNMAEKSIFQLMFEKKDMEKKGDKIRHVHPMRFMGFVFADHYLKKCVRQIKKSSFKWNPLIEGVVKNMKTEYANNNLMQYVPGFAKLLNVNSEQVVAFIEKKDFEGLFRFLM